jgi:hypothetical protein
LAQTLSTIRALKKSLKEVDKAIESQFAGFATTLETIPGQSIRRGFMPKSVVSIGLKVTPSWQDTPAWHGEKQNPATLLPRTRR